MTRPPRRVAVVGALLLLLCVGAAGAQQPPYPRAPIALADEHARVATTIQRIHGVVAMTEQASTIPGTRFFQILFLQPIDHDRPERGTFTQRATLLHRSETAPMVLVLSGYDLAPATSYQNELTALLAANQLFVEHRFFGESIPPAPDWSDLTIAQSAADHHAIVAAFRSTYRGRWLSTGRSKGGMASVYHRSFYPDDVDATVPYVAPSSHGVSDERYTEFLDRVGTDVCRQALLDLRRAALTRRAELVPRLTPPQLFSIFPPDKAFEVGVLDLRFVFWQYGTSHPPCASIPAPDAPAAQIYDFLDRVVAFIVYDDEVLNWAAPYYYQAATELGSPEVDDADVRDLLHFPDQAEISFYPPLGVEKVFDPEVMPHIEAWVRDHGERLLFLYGENDPWTSAAFEVAAGNDSWRYVVTGAQGDHSAVIAELPSADRAAAQAKIAQWMGVTIAPAASALAAAADPTVGMSDPRRRPRRPMTAALEAD